LVHERHVILPEDLAKTLPVTHLMTETEWRNIGIQMSTGWKHYMRHEPGMYHFVVIVFFTNILAQSYILWIAPTIYFDFSFFFLLFGVKHDKLYRQYDNYLIRILRSLIRLYRS